MTNDSTNLPDNQPGESASPYTSALPAGDVLSDGAADDGPKRRIGWAGAAGAGALVLALVGGVTYGFAALSGGGAQPDAALPAGAFAYGELDLDPSAGQKVDGFRFMRQFPELAKQLKDDDLRRSLFEAIAPEAGWEEIDYEKDVEPWLGDRLAVAAYPSKQFGGSADSNVPTVVVALQIADEDAAKEGLDRLVKASVEDSTVGGGTGDGDAPGYVIEGEYALLAATAETAEQAREAAKDGPLSADEDFAADMSAMDDGIASVWVDTAAAVKAAGPLAGGVLPGGLATTSGASGRASFVVRFDGPDTLELAGRVADAEAVADIEPATLEGMADLPATSVAALGLAGGEDMVDPMWDSLRKQLGAQTLESMVAEAESQLDVTLPDDLRTLLGSNLLVALDGEGLDADDPSVGARVTTDPAKAQPLLDRLAPMLQSVLAEATVETTDDGYVVATNPATAERFTDLGSGDTLGDDEHFSRALPDVDSARAAIWVDLEVLLGMFGVADENSEPLAGVGMTASYEGSSGEFRVRLVTK